MDFGSRYVYAYDLSDTEEVSDDEFEEGMTLSDSDEEESTAERSAKPAANVATNGRMGGAGPAASPGAPGAATGLDVEVAAPPPPPPAPAPSRAGSLKNFFTSKVFGSSSKEKKEEDGPPPSEGRQKKKKSHWRMSTAERRERSRSPAGNWRRARRADTNVVVVKFDTLTETKNMHAGEAVECTSCKAMLSHVSKLHSQDDEQVWTCEFCNFENIVDVEPEEVPKTQDVTYMLQPAPSMEATTTAGKDQSLVIFCVDVSGSMCVTTEVPGKVNLRGADRLARLQSLNDERENQWLPNQRRNVTYVSRLQGVQAAVDHQLGTMATEHPDRRVGLISFNNEVTVVGDASAPELVVAGDKLGDREALLKVAEEVTQPNSIKDSRNVLGDKVFDLEERGATALGPALLLSVAIAGQVPGSKVIVCTDGIANVGLGSLEKAGDSEEELKKAAEFYTNVSLLAQEKGVSVSVISIKGTDCKMLELGRVADETGGQVNIVDPLKLTQEFGSILADPIIATNVSAKFHVHARLYIRDEESMENTVERYVGNVTKTTEITFEYGMRTKKKNKKQKTSKVADTSSSPPGTSADQKAEGDAGEAAAGAAEGATAGPSKTEPELNEVPFQLLIKYTDLEGAQAMRCMTQNMPITHDRQLAEEEMDIAVLGVHNAQKSAQLALHGKYTSSRMNALMGQRLVARQAKKCKSKREAYKGYVSNIAPIEMYLNEAQHVEVVEFGNRLSDDESDPEICNAVKSKSKPTSRRALCNDITAQQMYATKSMSSKLFKKK